MNWATFYLVCFLVGFALSALSFLLGSLNFHVHGHFHVHLGHGGAIGTHAHGGGAHPAGNGTHNAEGSWFNFGTITAFLAWFGGAGFLLTAYSGLTLGIVIVLALLAGTAGASIMFWFIAKVLMKHDRALDARDFEMIGVLGTVIMPIREGGTGEIVFSQEGTRRCAGARSEDGSSIDKKTEVIVTRYEKGIAYVRRWDELTEGEASTNRQLGGTTDHAIQ
jgi:membrane protein implicated in regulation of membrane protease activity